MCTVSAVKVLKRLDPHKLVKLVPRQFEDIFGLMTDFKRRALMNS